MQVDELKTLVKELHKNGIEVMLDVVFNHTAEGNEHGPDDLLPRARQPDLLHAHARRATTTTSAACGNTLNCNNPVVRNMVLDCLRYWAAEYHIDGFRFDLAAILGRDPNGAPLANPPLLESLAFDPVLAQVQAGRRGLGRRRPVPGRLASRRTAAGPSGTASTATRVRKFLKGDDGPGRRDGAAPAGLARPVLTAAAPTAIDQLHHLPRRLHAADLCRYNDKHNEANGEDNNDGANDNNSWNCGWRRRRPTTRRSTRCARGR